MTLVRKILNLVKSFLKSKFFKSSIYVSLSKVFSSICNLLFMIFAVNILNKAENGIFQYYLGYLPVILAVAEFGLPSAIVKFISSVSDNKEKIGVILSSSLLIKIISFLLLLALGFGAYTFYAEDPLIIFILLIGGTTISFVSFFESIFVSFQAYKALAFWNPLANVMRLILLYLTHKYSELPLTYLDILAIFSLSPIFILILFFFIFNRNKIYWGGKLKEITHVTKELSLFNTWAFVASIFAIISDRLEIFLINKYHSSEQVAVYGTALQLFSGFVIILSTLNSLIYPRLSALVHTDEFKNFLLKSVFAGFAIAILLSPGYLLAEPILNLLFNHKYEEAIPVFKILYPNYMLQLVFAPLGIALFAMGKPRILAILALLRLVFGYILDTALIPEFGVLGAGTAFLLGQVISWLVLVGYFWAMFWK
ncbi:MAG TPA: oligosaccharide flippase family protein [Leptospiraceae bacterium]|nr:oligosaccharide flippase family protein [Leptospiraceae bacterium]HMW03552.1 oligosaccharide flippase family protein [Leptospiraceae bacterium]HMY29527.1 oligosaccharide flippase family protein [Leptospiraceae bacterium]HMZ64833.1 oligosaccharide flippase family protein [Leptospiraceae bacterium]HNA10186.1 oligosaccharide flippase family protein [Leptospiraceae bacterium]